MAWSEELADELGAHLSGDLPSLSESWQRCFGEEVPIRLAGNTAEETPPEGFDKLRGGLLLAFATPDGWFYALCPIQCGLPGWYASPDASQSSRLETLAVEWSIELFPESITVETTEVNEQETLVEFLDQFEETADTRFWRIDVHPADPDSDTAGAIGEDIFLLLAGPLPPRAEPAPPPEPEPVSAAAGGEPVPDGVVPSPVAMLAGGNRLLPSILKLKVTAIVQLAQKRIDLKQLLGIAPGTLITFTRSCEAPLNMYVNNAPFCQGEAVKIGEKFGLKITTMTPGSTEDAS